jgi:hypothetical protein
MSGALLEVVLEVAELDVDDLRFFVRYALLPV